MPSRDELRAAILAACEAPRQRKGSKGRHPRQTMTLDATYRLALAIEKEALKNGGNRRQAIKDVMGINNRPIYEHDKTIERGKKALRRRQDAVGSARAASFTANIYASLDELERRIANVPHDRREPLLNLPMSGLLSFLRDNQIDGNFPLDLLEDLKLG